MTNVIVTTTSGAVRGIRADHDGQGIARFLGIPYARPPFGALRFQLPAPAARWEGVRDATAFGPTAPKPDAEHSTSPLDYLEDPTVPGDDCLNLNIWTPDPAAAGLPVMVWIHGGAFLMGSSRMPLYDGTTFARDGVVFVSMNYRMGMEGFGMLPDAPANLGIRDILLALEWVRDNVAAFGGDPDNVTIFGESAGAGCALALLARDPGTFRRAAISSAALTGSLVPEDAARVAAQVARLAGVQPTAAGLQAVDPQTLANHAKQAFLDMAANPDPERWGASTVAVGMPFTTISDGEFLPRHPLDLVIHGAGAAVDLLIGSTADEMFAMVAAAGPGDEKTAERARGYLAAFGASAAAYAAYARRVQAPSAVLAAAMTDALFRIPAVRIAQARSKAPTYVYEFGWPSPIPGIAAAHALDLGFIFDNLGHNPFEGDQPPQTVADAVHAAWVRFATSGDPGWGPYSAQTREQMVFDVAGGVVHDLRGEERQLWGI
jgi:para-nitrobenzyl esterase